MFASITGKQLIAQKVSFVKPGAQWDQGSCVLWEVVLISLEFPAALTQKLAAIPAEFNHVRLNRRQLLLLLFTAGSLFNDLKAVCDLKICHPRCVRPIRNACYHSVQNLLSSRFLSKNLKIKI